MFSLHKLTFRVTHSSLFFQFLSQETKITNKMPLYPKMMSHMVERMWESMPVVQCLIYSEELRSRH